MLLAAEESGKTFGVAYYRRTYPKVQRAKQLLAAGAIGKPVLAELTCHGWFDGTGSRSWLVDPAKAGGGPLCDIASHRIDVLNFLFGQPLRVAGQLSNVVHRYAVEDNATVMIEYAGGVRGVVDVRWHSKVSRDECRIRGTEGEMELSPLNGPEFIYPGGRENLPPHANLHYPMIENFVDAVEGKAPLLASGASSYWTDWVTEMTRARTQPQRTPSTQRESIFFRSRSLGGGERPFTTGDTEYTEEINLLSVFVLHYFSALHHELHALKRRDVLQRVAIHRDYVCPFPGSSAADLVRQAEQIGGVHRAAGSLAAASCPAGP